MENTTVQKTAVIYCRVSSAEQVQGTSLAMQERLCNEYAAREKLQVLNVYVEQGESAKTANRTEFQKALAFCATKKPRVDFFIVHKVDRFARNQVDHHATRALLKKYGTELRSVTEPISDDPVGKAMEGMLSVFAEFDNNVRSARSRGGMMEKVKRGEWVWPAPYGYKRLTRGGNLVVDDKQAPYVRTIFEEYAKGTHSLYSLARYMAKQGMRTSSGKKPQPQLIDKILCNSAYYGLINAKKFGIEVEAKFAPIIDEDLFWQCQPRKRSKLRGSKKLAADPRFPLRRFVVCAACDKPLTASYTTGRKGKKYPYYHHHKQGCPLASALPQDVVEQKFAEFLGEVSPSIKSEKAFRAVVMDVWQSNFKKLDADNARLRKEIETLEIERQRIFDMHRTGKYTDEEFYEQKQLVTVSLYQKRELLDDKRIEEFNMDEALDTCFQLTRDSGKTWQRLAHTPLLRDWFQKSVFPEKVTFDGEKFGTAKLSLIYKMNRERQADNSTLVTLRGFEPRFVP